VSAEIGGTVAVIDAKTYEVIKVVGFDIPGIPAELIQPTGIDFSKDRKLAFVALGPFKPGGCDRRRQLRGEAIYRPASGMS
jgi:hypothetical protein